MQCHGRVVQSTPQLKCWATRGRSWSCGTSCSAIAAISGNCLSARRKASPATFSVAVSSSSAQGLLTREEAKRGQRAKYSLTEAGIQVLPIMAALGTWGLAHRDGNPRLRVRAELLRDAEPGFIEAMMDELREVHLGIPRPDPDAVKPSERFQDAYERVIHAEEAWSGADE